MARAKVNTRIMRQLGTLFATEGHHVQSTPDDQIRHTLLELGLNWRGASRQRFDQLFAQWRKEAHQFTRLSFEIAQHLEQTAGRIEEIDTEADKETDEPPAPKRARRPEG